MKITESRNKREGVYWCKTKSHKNMRAPARHMRIPWEARLKYSKPFKSIQQLIMYAPRQRQHEA